jgi:hypothetical protein
MVKVKPVILRQHTVHDLVVENNIVWNFSVGEDQRNRVVPWLFRLGRIYRYARIFLKLHDIEVHCGAGNFGNDLIGFCVRDHLKRDAAYDQLILDSRMMLAHETAAAPVQQPVNFKLISQNPVGNPISLKVIGLFLIHWNEDRIGLDNSNDKKQAEQNGETHRTDHLISYLKFTHCC